MKKILIAAALSLTPFAGLAQPLKIGVVPGAYGDTVAVAAAEAKEKGLEIEVIEFSDWTTPNLALDAGDIDLNFFQHEPFLKNANAQAGTDLVVVGTGILANMGLYSLKHASFDAIPQNGTVAIANDPVNQGRALLLLEKSGLIALKPDVGYFGTLDDITENPKNLSFTEVEGPQLARITGDVDLAQGYPHFIVAAGTFDPTSALLYSGIEDRQFAVSFVARSDRRDDPAFQSFISLFQNSEAVAEQAKKSFSGSDKLYILAWKDQ